MIVWSSKADTSELVAARCLWCDLKLRMCIWLLLVFWENILQCICFRLMVHCFTSKKQVFRSSWWHCWHPHSNARIAHSRKTGAERNRKANLPVRHFLERRSPFPGPIWICAPAYLREACWYLDMSLQRLPKQLIEMCSQIKNKICFFAEQSMKFRTIHAKKKVSSLTNAFPEPRMVKGPL